MTTEEEIKSVYKISREIYDEDSNASKKFSEKYDWGFSKYLESLNVKNSLLKIVLIRQKNMSEYIKELEQKNIDLSEKIKRFREQINNILEN